MIEDVTEGASGLPIDAEMFVREWMNNGYKVPEAYLKTWPGKITKQTAGIRGNAKLKEPLVAAYAAGVIKAHLDKYDVTEDSIIGELANIAFLDIADIVNKDGMISNLSDMPENARRAVSSVSENIEGKCTVKFCNKEKALELLAKWKKMLTEMHEIAGVEDLAAAILGARKRTMTTKETTVEEMLE